MIYIGFDNDEDIKEAEYQNKLNTKTEKWKYILTKEGKRTKYMISSFGRLKNISTGIINDFKNQTSIYYRVSITYNGYTYKESIHRLVATYFCKIPKRHRESGLTFDDLVPNHKDGNKHHNASFNLEWVTQKENTDDAWRTGLCDGIRGENTHLAKIDEATAKQIIAYILDNKNNAYICEVCNVSNKTVQHIRSKECWKHLSVGLVFPKLVDDMRYSKDDETIHHICVMIELKKYTDKEIGKMCGVSREYVKDIRNHKRRKKISKNYNF